MSLKGATQLRGRLRVARLAFKDYGRNLWAPETVRRAKSRVAVRTGKTRASIRIKSATQRKAVVQAAYGARFVESGAQAHDIKPRKKRALKWQARGTVFVKRAHKGAQGAHPFLRNSARDALLEHGFQDHLVEIWNSAA